MKQLHCTLFDTSIFAVNKISISIIRVCILTFVLVTLPVSAQPAPIPQNTHPLSIDESTQLHLTENEKKWLTEHHLIKVGMDPDYAPYEWIDKDGNHVGMVVDYMHRLEKKLGLHFEIVKNKPWTELLKMAKNGELDMITSIVKTPERSEYLTFSEPYRDTPTIIIDNGEGSFIGSLKQLSNKRVSVEKGYFMEEFMKNNYPKIHLITAPSTIEALKMVVDGVADAYVGDANVADYTIKSNNYNTLRFSGQTEYISHQSFGLIKANEPLALILTKAMATIPKEETDAMFNRWLNIEQGIKSETLIKYGSAIGLIFLVIGYWVFRLRREISYRKIAEEKLRNSETLYRQLTEDVTDVIWKTDQNLFITYISPSDERLRGFSADEVIGHHVFEMFTDEGIATITEKIRERQETEKQGFTTGSIIFEAHHRCKDGSLIWGEVLSKPERDKSGTIIGYHGITREITERKQMQDEIQALAFYDPLTKLPNRRLLHDRLKQSMSNSKRSQKYCALIFLDLDNFKPLNDIHGHSVGDLLLIQAAERVKSCVREIDTVARFGGDEFIVMLNELDESKAESITQAERIAEKIRSVLSVSYQLTHESVTVEHHCTASIGVLIFKGQEKSEDELFNQADAAMYQAKEAGRNNIRFYDLDD
ncbi:diguanylate cyclase domain-containing protein [Sulfuricurvum sp.]|uniref:diguanylate cyclase domain-containing protein n=1 Tax=Sulfuricurvum sp. TaxID=2025608 RepID=UPI00356ADE37